MFPLITMKRLTILRLLCAILSLNLFVFCSKGSHDHDIAYPPEVKFDKDFVSFTSDGGKDVITNLKKGWLHIINASERVFEDNEWRIIYPNIYEAEDGMVNLSYDENNLDGRWFHISIPEPPNSHTLIIEVSPNSTGQSRQLHVSLRIADCFKGVTIEQQ